MPGFVAPYPAAHHRRPSPPNRPNRKILRRAGQAGGRPPNQGIKIPHFLFLCNKEIVDDFIEPVPTSYDGTSPPVKLSLKTIEGTTLAVDPFPFDVNPLGVLLIRRQMDRSVFADPAAFREAYFKTMPRAVVFTLRGQSH